MNGKQKGLFGVSKIGYVTVAEDANEKNRAPPDRTVEIEWEAFT